MIKRINSKAAALLKPLALIAIVMICARPSLAIETPAKQAIVMDMSTGTYLLEKDPDSLMAPASMSKLMTVTMLFNRLKEGSLKMSDTFPVSKKAWKKGGSKMFVKVDTRVNVEDLLRGIIVQSGNDACIVVAEGLSGSEEEFANSMTAHARELGLEQSVFRNSTGWPDPNHRMTPRELALLSKHIIEEYPEFYKIFSEKSFKYNKIKQSNRNPLLYKNMGADGLKTGHTEESGYGLTGSVIRDGRRIIVVVNGLKSASARARESERLMEWAFREFNTYSMFRAGDIVDKAQVWLGDKDYVPMTVESDFKITLSRKARRSMKVKVVYDEPIPAPIIKGMPVARLVVQAEGTKSIEVPLIATEDIGRPGVMKRVTSALKYIVWGASAH